MQFEQPAVLNRYVDASIPFTVKVRWQALKPCLPLLICSSLLLVEQVLFGLWLNDRSLRSGLPLLAACALAPVVVIMLAFEVQTRVTHRSKRKLKLEAKKVYISPAKYYYIAFKQILGWRLEPVAEAPEFSKLTLEYSLDKKRKLLREWSMILRHEQECNFLSELEQLQRAGSTSAEVVRLPQPLVRKKVNRRLRSAAAVALGFYFLIHGLPVLGGCLFPASGETEQSRPGSRLSARGKAKLREFVALHFSSLEEFRKFMILAGASLTALGAGLYFWGLSAIKKENALAAAESGSARDRSSIAADVGESEIQGGPA
jgi:hypothetical protein